MLIKLLLGFHSGFTQNGNYILKDFTIHNFQTVCFHCLFLACNFHLHIKQVNGKWA